MAYASKSETTYALYFLQKLGAKTTNAYLLTAVIAWLRKESGGKIIGYNPFNVGTSKYALRYRTLKDGRKVAVFGSIKSGAYAAADRLLRATVGGADGYRRIVTVARRGAGSTEQTKQTQALDFLMAVALSKWDANHYGLGKGASLDTYDAANNALIKVWATISGVPAVTLPAEPVKPTKAELDYEKRKKRPRPPKPLEPPSMPGNIYYIDPQEVLGFYRNAHRVSDLGNLPD